MFTQDTMLRHHLQHNHYPPLPEGLVPYAAEAIRLANDGDWDVWVAIPTDEGVAMLTRPDGGANVTVSELVEELHLDGFIDRPED